MNTKNTGAISNINLPKQKLAALARQRERFVRMRPVLLMVEERAKAKPDNILELNLRLWDAFKQNNSSEMTRLLRAGARVDSIEENLRTEERNIKTRRYV